MKIKNKCSSKGIYSLITKTKFRRLSQPGLSRYTTDGLGTEFKQFEVKILFYV
jgi:hypothetical protein